MPKWTGSESEIANFIVEDFPYYETRENIERGLRADLHEYLRWQNQSFYSELAPVDPRPRPKNPQRLLPGAANTSFAQYYSPELLS
jgi:hypothetical protein